MGVLTVALSSDNDAGTIVSDPEITLGETTTSETASDRTRDDARGAGSHGRAARWVRTLVGVSADQFSCGGPLPMLVRVTAEPVRVAATVTVSFGANELFVPAAPGGSA